MAINQQPDLKNKNIDFCPPPLKVSKKGKKIFQLMIIFFWISVGAITIWQLSWSQLQSNLSSKDSQDFLPIVYSDRQDTGNSDVRFDEILGSKIFENPNGNDQTTDNPMKGSGSIEKLLEGKEIVIPKK